MQIILNFKGSEEKTNAEESKEKLEKVAKTEELK